MISLCSPGKKVVKLEYEAYTSMAVKQLTEICVGLRERWPISKVAIHHRLGYVSLA